MDLDKKTPEQAAHGHQPPAPRPAIPPGAVAFERMDADPRSIIRTATVLIAVSLAAAAAAFGLFRALGTREARQDPPPPPLAREENRLPPAPRLQTAPAGELAALREEEKAALAGFGWADEKAGVARIPIEEAMALVVAGMRAPGTAPAAAPSGAASPAAPSAAPAKAVKPAPSAPPAAPPGQP